MGRTVPSRRLRWRLLRSFAVFALAGGSYAFLASLEQQAPPADDALQLGDLTNVGSSKNDKKNDPPKTSTSSSSQTTYTYDLTQPINSQLTLSP